MRIANLQSLLSTWHFSREAKGSEKSQNQDRVANHRTLRNGPHPGPSRIKIQLLQEKHMGKLLRDSTCKIVGGRYNKEVTTYNEMLAEATLYELYSGK